MTTLNNKQLVFVEEYLRTNNGAQSARKAGYSEKTAKQKACSLLKDPKIMAYIEERNRETVKKTDFTLEYRLKKLSEVIEKGGQMHKSGHYQNLNAINRAIEIMNGMLGLGEDKKAIPIKVMIGYEDASRRDEDEEDQE